MDLRGLVVLLGLCSSVAFRIRLKHNHEGSNTAGDVGFTANSGNKPQILEGVCNVSPFDKRRGKDGKLNCEVLLDVPPACAGRTTKCGIVFCFPASGKNTDYPVKELMSKVHNGYKLIGVYPNGAGKWVKGGGSPDHDDKAFVLHIASALKAKGWQGRRYAFGGSSGGNMVQEVGTNSILGFSGIGVLVANLRTGPDRRGQPPYNWLRPVLGEGTGTEGSCTVPTAVLSLGGTNDETVPYDGGNGPAGQTFMSFEATNALWAKVNNCDEHFETVEVEATWGSRKLVVEKMIWNCPYTTPQIHYKVIGYGHAGLKDIEGKCQAEAALDFFAKVDMELNLAGKPAEPELPDGCRHRLG